ncbi:IS110 family transposase [Sulfurimonas sediminis]|uniref:IS110 family transposase n=1 Tax=Sulfurimonas sediminis TaxID=2590020 RepID=A0A7M1B0Q7_9BACT|nr:IS110 family transposase [Sulfurimonas sediminis]QOP42655.1 IS110 family transposase [Sulfurimonas sediminis]QOP43293.1 IS110 family transposase [Sulfurimonas sediminis]
MYQQFCGIDVSKDSFDITLLESSGEVKLQEKLSMDIEGFNALLKHLSSYSKEELLVSMEATGIYHLPLLSFLLEHSFKSVVINPILIKSFIGSTTLRKTKNDKKDATSIALFSLKSYQSLHLATTDAIENIRPLIRERESLSKEVARLKTEIKANLTQLFPELLKNTNIFTKSILNLLLQAPSRKAIRNLKKQKIQKLLDSTSGNKVRISAGEILFLAKNSIAVSDKYLEKVLTSKIRRLITVQDELSFLDEELQNSLEDTDINDDIEILQSIPGIGTVTSKNFMVEVSSVDKFKSVKQLCAFIGIDPSVRQSGTSVNYRGKISKRGNANLRRTIWQMATGVIRSCEKFKAYYDKKRSEGKKFKQAVIAVANKLLKTIFVLLKNKTKFDENLVCGVSK